MRITDLAWDEYRVEHSAHHQVSPAEVWEVCTDPQFRSYEEEAAFWDNLGTADFMEDDGEWFHFEVANERAVRVAILPDIAQDIARRARAQGVSIETLVNAWLIEHMHEISAAA